MNVKTKSLRSLHDKRTGELADDHNAVKVEHFNLITELFAITTKHHEDVEAGKARLALLERSLWRKCVDLIKRVPA